MKYIDTKDSITVVIGGKPYSISSGHKIYAEIVEAVRRDESPVNVLEVIERDASRVRSLLHQRLSQNLVYNEGVVLYKGRALHNHAISRLVAMVEAKLDVAPLANFVEKQMLNPSEEVIEHLYKFLEFGKIPITPDGDFLAYKAVRADYRDIHSGSYLNSVGAKPSMPREQVDPDRATTCSRGLHVCSYAYLPHFSHQGGHVMMCKINPVYVVAIPNDYNDTKMRVAEYEVVGEVTSYYERGEDVLAQDLVKSERFEVCYFDGDDPEETFDSFYTLDEAKAQANALDVERAWVVDTHTDEVIYTA